MINIISRQTTKFLKKSSAYDFFFAGEASPRSGLGQAMSDPTFLFAITIIEKVFYIQ